jgi:hypothetical protein
MGDLLRGQTIDPAGLALTAAATLALAGGCLVATARMLQKERIVLGR